MNRNTRLRVILLLIIAGTIPFYCLGLVLLQGNAIATKVKSSPTASATLFGTARTSSTIRPPTTQPAATWTTTVTETPTLTWTASLTYTPFIPPTSSVTVTATMTATWTPQPTATLTNIPLPTATYTEIPPPVPTVTPSETTIP